MVENSGIKQLPTIHLTLHEIYARVEVIYIFCALEIFSKYSLLRFQVAFFA